MALVVVACEESKAAVNPTHVVQVYGDSLAWEARSFITQTVNAQSGWKAVTNTRAGTAPCDWLAKLAADVASKRPTVRPTQIVLEFVGNSYTPCMTDPSTGAYFVSGSQQWLDKYRTDVRQMFGLAEANSIPVLIIKHPVLNGYLIDVNDAAALDAVLVEEAHNFRGVSYTDGPRLAVSAQGSFTYKLPCLSTEGASRGCSGGQISVREPLGVHFCPSGFTAGSPCPVYSSGARRFGAAIGAAA